MNDDPLGNYELIFLLGLAFQQVQREFVEQLDAAGYDDLRPAHGFALQVITRGTAVTASEVAESLGVTKQAGGQLVDQLVERGYVTRETHPGGGRRRLLVLTARGHQHMRDAGPILRQVERSFTKDLSRQRLSELRRNLVAIIRAATPAPEVPPLRLFS